MSTFTVDVKFSKDVKDPGTGSIRRDAEWAHGTDWHRLIVEAPDGTEAELIACQIVGTQGGQTVVWSCVVDWSE